MIIISKCKKGISLSTTVLFGIFALVITIIASIYAYQIGVNVSQSKHEINVGEISPIIDGKISPEEWNAASLYMYPKWIPNWNSTNARSAWNYLSVGYDNYSLYVALDMESITSVLPSEIIEIHIITNGEYFDTFSRYMVLRDWGVEALVYDVKNESIVYNDQKNTILDANVMVGYNNGTMGDYPHQNIEIGIPLSELKYFDKNGMLGILIIGKYDGGEFYFASSSISGNITYYNSEFYIGISFGKDETRYI